MLTRNQSPAVADRSLVREWSIKIYQRYTYPCYVRFFGTIDEAAIYARDCVKCRLGAVRPAEGASVKDVSVKWARSGVGGVEPCSIVISHDLSITFTGD